GALRRSCEGADGDRRCVRRKHRFRRKDRVGAPEDLLLYARLLDHRLDHQVGRNEIVDLLDPRKYLVGRRAALLSELRQAFAHRLERALDRTRPAPTTRTWPNLTP